MTCTKSVSKLAIACSLLFSLPSFAAGERQMQLLEIVQVAESAAATTDQSRLEIMLSYRMLAECMEHAVALSDGEDAGVSKWSTPKFRHYKSAAIAQTAYCRANAEAYLKFLETTRAPSRDLYAMKSIVEKLQKLVK